ncbi:CidA/LrgA family holin-like protein [Bacillus sp. NEB1478]|uniref:CidA/LrgA family holin-like protein n=1 Tax=Bacillus sp. NEB1478 TaxID=3073816 RepID=UPI0028736019|nr:CidA/LrgA family holin-like protein [Bacillus sp. NEB1478]WNB92620.1 CidA/LrgA family holin-like protein [Bacillus sp. NEB1478]
MGVLIRVLQVGILIFFYLIGNAITKYLHLPIPGSIVGLILLFLLLQFKVVKLEWVELGATFLLSELLLFFVPSAVGIIQYEKILSVYGIKLVLVIVLSTIAVMACTGLSSELFSKLRKDVSSDSDSRNN